MALVASIGWFGVKKNRGSDIGKSGSMIAGLFFCGGFTDDRPRVDRSHLILTRSQCTIQICNGSMPIVLRAIVSA